VESTRPSRTIVAISTGTFVRVLVIIALVWAWLRLWPWLLIALIGVSLAIAVEPAVRWVERRGLPRWIAAPLLVLGGTLALIVFLAASAASLRADAALLEQRVADSYGNLMAALPPGLGHALASFAPSSDALFAAGQMLIGGFASIAVAVVLTLYFLLDGRRTFGWLLAFAPPRLRPKVVETAEGASGALAAYVRGNAITSAIAGVAAWVVLLVLHVPAALLLAVLAALCDFLPVVGIIFSAGPAILLALMVSPATALAVAAYFALYHVVENYYIAPKVYGHTLRLSNLAVIAAFMAGAELGGVLGALVALPLAAIYPVIERVWLRETAREDLPGAHRRIAAQPEH
jgi:predicted PurR-regulated permease PerM